MKPLRLAAKSTSNGKDDDHAPEANDTVTDLSPDAWFESPPGEDGTIIGRVAIRTWLEELSRATERLQMTTFGTSTEGNPLDALFIGNDVTVGRLAEIERDHRDVVNTLLSGTAPRPWTMPIVLMTSGIHATEIGGPQSIPELVYWIVTSDDADAATIRERVLTIVVPTLNPDGMDLVEQWHQHTLGTDQAGTLPPLLYHRFAGHDNNRDWLYRNLAETRSTIDALHNTWLPHVTLDQHQMNKNGPRFVLPPYADPWEPNVHPSIIAGTSMLGQAVASDLTAGGFAGVMTGRYFDAWEPSRAIQHYRGGIRILAEAASANLAHPIALTVDQLTSTPLPQHMEPTASSPLPWRGGTWRLRDIMNYHIEAAKSLLWHVGIQPDYWTRAQAAALAIRPGKQLIVHIPFDRSAIDVAANRRLTQMLDGPGVTRGDNEGQTSATFPLDQPMSPLLSAVLLPKSYPNDLGPTPYDVTTHHLPLLIGATLQVSAGTANPALERDASAPNQYLTIDARCHAAPDIIELALPSGNVWRATKRELVEGVIVEAGTWIVDGSALPYPQEADRVSNGSLPTLARSAAHVQRRDIVLLDPGGVADTDHGWSRWWLQARSIPFLEAGIDVVAQLADVASSTTILVADMERSNITSRQIQGIRELINAGADVIAFGGAGRALAEGLAASVSATEFPTGGTVQAPGALVRLRVEPDQQIGMGLDRAIPVMFQRDGTFAVSDEHDGVSVLARFAARDTLISGWMSDANPLRNAPAIVRVRLGGGSLYAFSFKPLFRGQTLVSSPLVHNLLYSTSEPASCPPFAPEKTPAGSTNDHTF